LWRDPDEGKGDLFPGQVRPVWTATPGILRQGSDMLYSDQTVKIYQKGHLAPAHTLSRTRAGYESTFTYTNAVPQCQRFNSRAHWAKYENRIRTAAMLCTEAQPGQQAAVLYLLTGTSFAHILPGDPPNSNQPNIEDFSQNHPTIAIPNSLWTAGCCVRPNGDAVSFAVMGNNVQDGGAEGTRQITLTELQNILTADVRHHDLAGGNVNLFLGNPNCLNDLAQDLLRIKN